MATLDTFPILYFNMAGEMIYIIDQRLQAQKIEPAKAVRVLNEIILSVFNAKLICEVFKPHNTITLMVLKTIFEKLAHSSIMRLNDHSMNKLFDLMIMVIKYQLFACPKPSDIITITDNHLLSVIEMAKMDPEGATGATTTAEIVNVVRNQFLCHYHSYDLIQFQSVRFRLLNFLKDIRTRVSIFLREGTQTDDGMFVIPVERVMVECECQIPGVIRYFRGAQTEIIRTEHFNVGGDYVIDESRTALGLNMKEAEQTTDGDPGDLMPPGADGTNQPEIDLLARLLCKRNSADTIPDMDVSELRFDFLNMSEKQRQLDAVGELPNGSAIQVIDSHNEQLIEIIQDLEDLSILSIDRDNQLSSTKKMDEADDDIDLLELMDS